MACDLKHLITKSNDRKESNIPRVNIRTWKFKMELNDYDQTMARQKSYRDTHCFQLFIS